jgi:hypothetical protein
MGCHLAPYHLVAAMSRALIVLRRDEDRAKATEWVAKAPPGTRVEFKAVKRTTPQNDRMWAFLTDIAQQVKWHGVSLKADDWKQLFLHALKQELRVIPNLDGSGLVALGRSSSDLSKEEMADLLSLIEAWGANHNVRFNDPKEAAA